MYNDQMFIKLFFLGRCAAKNKIVFYILFEVNNQKISKFGYFIFILFFRLV